MSIAAFEMEHAYRECEQITRREAANFYYGIRLLPRSKRLAMCASYAFARRIDDIGDGDLDRDRKLLQLSHERQRLTGLTEGPLDTSDPVITALTHSRERYNLPVQAFEALIDGVELDVRGAQYESFDELVGYCRCVAGSIGRLCVAIFTDGTASPETFSLADDLGVALQLTNILRDVLEDQQMGRVYLPEEDRRRFGSGDSAIAPEREATELIRFEAARAAEWFDHGMRLADQLDGRSASCLQAMTGIYRRILDRIIEDPALVLRGRISLSPVEKTWVAARSLIAAGAAGRRR